MTFTGQRQGVWLGQNWRLRRSSAGLGGSRQYDRGRTWCCGRRASPRMPTSGSRKSTSPSSRTARSVSRSTRLPHPAALRPPVSRPGSTACHESVLGFPSPRPLPPAGRPLFRSPTPAVATPPNPPRPMGWAAAGPQGLGSAILRLYHNIKWPSAAAYGAAAGGPRARSRKSRSSATGPPPPMQSPTALAGTR